MNKPCSYKRRAFLAFALLLLGLGLSCFVWVRQEQQQYALNRELIDALKKSDTTQALTLVKAGADPNTHLKPLAALSWPDAPISQTLLIHRLHLFRDIGASFPP